MLPLRVTLWVVPSSTVSWAITISGTTNRNDVTTEAIKGPNNSTVTWIKRWSKCTGVAASTAVPSNVEVGYTEDRDAIAQAQTLGAAGDLTINGADATAGVVDWGPIDETIWDVAAYNTGGTTYWMAAGDKGKLATASGASPSAWTQVATTAADLTAQVKSVTKYDIADIQAASKSILTPYSTAPLKIVLSSVVADDNNVGKVEWSCANTGAARGTGTTYKVPTGLTEPKSSVIVAEVTYGFRPLVGLSTFFNPGSFDMKRTFYARPRRSLTVKKTDNTC